MNLEWAYDYKVDRESGTGKFVCRCCKRESPDDREGPGAVVHTDDCLVPLIAGPYENLDVVCQILECDDSELRSAARDMWTDRCVSSLVAIIERMRYALAAVVTIERPSNDIERAVAYGFGVGRSRVRRVADEIIAKAHVAPEGSER